MVLPTIGLLIGLGFLVAEIRPSDVDTFWQAGHSATYYGTTWGVNGTYYVYPAARPDSGLIPGLSSWSPGWACLDWRSGPPRAVGPSGYGRRHHLHRGIGWLFALANPLLLTGVGNPQIMIAAICVIGFRYPAAWSFAVLTKIAPGIGLLWFVARGEWRNLAIAIGATTLIAVVSFVLAPQPGSTS